MAPPSQPNVRVFTENMTLTEGEFARYSVVLDKKPTANVTISVASTDTSEGVSSVSSFVFTPSNWNVSQRANVVTTDDGVVDGDVAFQMVLANAVSTDPNYNGRDVADIDVTVLDGNVAELVSSGSDAGQIDQTNFDAVAQRVANHTVSFGHAQQVSSDETATSPRANLEAAADQVFGTLFSAVDAISPKRLRRAALLA